MIINLHRSYDNLPCVVSLLHTQSQMQLSQYCQWCSEALFSELCQSWICQSLQSRVPNSRQAYLRKPSNAVAVAKIGQMAKLLQNYRNLKTSLVQCSQARLLSLILGSIHRSDERYDLVFLSLISQQQPWSSDSCRAVGKRLAPYFTGLKHNQRNAGELLDTPVPNPSQVTGMMFYV